MDTISRAVIRLQQQVQRAASLEYMAPEQDQRISEAVTREQSRLLKFIRRRVADPRDAEDILQDVFCELVEANRLLMPIDHVTGWLFRVARNRITDLFRRKKPQSFIDREGENETPDLEDLLPSPNAGPEAEYARSVLLEELATPSRSCRFASARCLWRTSWKGVVSVRSRRQRA
ncbi:MAG TPA: sigma-70 family RNA polymerase sigma factor [Bryobacteraceae bacterium]|nr:sigma-70 family RNA polymerase sigma factor [Bryobacteraceae bacterium]